MSTIHYTYCPSCLATAISPSVSVKDFTVSQESFEIWQCDECELRFTQNIPDKASIGVYYQSADYISHSDSTKGLINQLYHQVRKITLKSKKQLVEKTAGVKNGKLLDIGAGTGAFSSKMQKAGWEVTAIEPDEKARTLAKTKHGLNALSIEEMDALPDGEYDVITLWHVLEHVHDLHQLFAQFNRLLKKGGVLVIAVPNYTSFDAKKYAHFWAAYDVPRHLYHFSPRSMNQLARKKGFQTVAMKPMWFDSFYVSMLSEKYKNESGNLLSAFLYGTWSNIIALFDPSRASSLIYLMKRS